VTDRVNPDYYHNPSGVECIEVTRHLNFCLGNVVKYVWRAGLKSDNPTMDLRKAKRYLEFELERLAIAESHTSEPSQR